MQHKQKCHEHKPKALTSCSSCTGKWHPIRNVCSSYMNAALYQQPVQVKLDPVDTSYLSDGAGST